LRGCEIYFLPADFFSFVSFAGGVSFAADSFAAESFFSLAVDD
jgi:hypothetical protein